VPAAGAKGSLAVCTTPNSPGGEMFVIVLTRRSTQLAFGYVFKSPFGGQGSIVSVDNLEEVGGPHLGYSPNSDWWRYFSRSPQARLGALHLVWRSLPLLQLGRCVLMAFVQPISFGLTTPYTQ